jgi:hypothetical protein
LRNQGFFIHTPKTILMQAVSCIKNGLGLMLFILFVACNNSETTSVASDKEDSIITKQDGTAVDNDSLTLADTSQSIPIDASPKTYSNQRFKDVTVEKMGEHTFLIKGKGQIFEASFSWVIEDGHEELQQGHEMTDAGAPEWGNFSFTVKATKKRPNSTLHLILFEVSAKDGSRQYELPILLY